MKRFAFFLMTSALCCALIALGCELYVRLRVDDGMRFDLEMWKYSVLVKVVADNPKIGHVHGGNRHAKLMGVSLDTNSKGLRDREFTYARTPGVLRIVMLGDSFTEGWGARLEDTFSKRIERLYAERNIKAEVINTGVGNWNTIQEVTYFLTEAFRYHPDIVVLNFLVNDAEPVPRASSPSWLMRVCYSCVFIGGRFDELRRRFSNSRDWASYYLDLYDDGHAAGWLDAKAAMRELADYCKEKGIRLLIANLPELHDVQNYRFQSITELARAAARENNVAFVDILPYLQAEASSNLWVTPPDPHPNARAHELIAAGLFDALQKLPP
jgi:lysophospholipase L1-like esterase